jgi:hypothetical protein
MDTIYRQLSHGEIRFGYFQKNYFAEHLLGFRIFENDNGVISFWSDSWYRHYLSNRYDVRHISTQINYNPDTVPGFEAKPFVRQIGDTLIIADYWAMPEHYDLAVVFSSAIDIGSNIDVRYDVASSQPKGEGAPTVEVIVKLTGFESAYPHETLTVAVRFASGASHHSRAPTDSERELGFRDARDSRVLRVPIPVPEDVEKPVFTFYNATDSQIDSIHQRGEQ